MWNSVLLAALLGGLPLPNGPAAALAALGVGGPVEPAVLLLVTGADTAHIKPRGCLHGRGGGLYRLGLARTLAEEPSAPQVLWLGVGNALNGRGVFNTEPADVYLEHLGDVGYAALGLGISDLDALGIERLRRGAEAATLPLVATNLVVHETGRHAFEESIVLETRAGRIAVLAVLEHRPDALWGDPTSGTILTTPPDRAIDAALSRLDADVDQVVLLSTLHQSAFRRLAAELSGIDFVLASAGHRFSRVPDEQHAVPTLYVGHWGQVLGVVGLDETGGAMLIHTVPVEPDFPCNPGTECYAPPDVPGDYPEAADWAQAADSAVDG